MSKDSIKRFVLAQWHDVRGNAKWDFFKWTFRGCLMIPSAATAIITYLRHAPIWEVVCFTILAAFVGIVIWCILVWAVLKIGNQFGIQDSSSNIDLEIEFIPSNPKPAKKHPCQIRIRNKSSTTNADDLKVELLSFTDELSAEHAKYYHPEFPYLLKPDSQNNTINPLDAAVVTAFYFESASKIEGREQKFVAGFDSGKSTEKNYALFHEKKNYPIKLSASARGMARVEKEFIMVFSNEDGIGRINLKPIIHLSEEEKRGKAEKAIEKLTEFSTVFFQRICAIRAIPASEYNPDKDDALWNANCAAIAYIQLNLNDSAGKTYDEGVAEINTYSIPRSGFGSTRFDDDKNVVLARFNKRILNLKRIVENIDSYIK